MTARISRQRPLGLLAAAVLVGMTTACGPVAPDQGAAAPTTVPPAAQAAPAPVPAPAPAPVPAPLPAPVEAPAPVVEAPAPAPEPAPAPAPPVTGQRLADYPFGPSSVWLADVSSAPVATDSAAMVSYLAGTVSDRYGGVAALNTYRYNNSYFVAAPGTPKVDVAFHDCQGKGYLPDGLTGPGGQFTQVPIPAGAVPAAGEDKAMSVYSPESDQLWEFWKAEQDAAGGWSACWGGRIDGVSQSAGFFLNGFGASASGLSITGGTVRLADVRSGSIEHAMTLAIPDPAARPELSWPAQRTDGRNTHPDAVPEGTRLRLDPSIDVDSLGLHPLAAMIAEAAQRYGFIVTDQSGAVAVSTESGVPEEKATGVDPWAQILGGTADYSVLENFPWDRLQALPVDYGKP